MRAILMLSYTHPHPYLFSPGAHQNHVRPFGGEKVHRTFSCFRLTSRKGRGESVKFFF